MPELILVSAGFDIHRDDPLGGMRVTPQGFAGLSRSVNTADRCCGGKVVMTLEGGYDLQGLKDSVRAVLREMAGLQRTDIADIAAGGDARMLAYLLWRVRRIHGRYWKSLGTNPQHGDNPEPPTRSGSKTRWRASQTILKVDGMDVIMSLRDSIRQIAQGMQSCEEWLELIRDLNEPIRTVKVPIDLQMRWADSGDLLAVDALAETRERDRIHGAVPAQGGSLPSAGG